MTEHSINRSGSRRTDSEEDTDSDGDDVDEQDNQKSEAEIKRELRQSAIGRALLKRNRELKRRQEGRR